MATHSPVAGRSLQPSRWRLVAAALAAAGAAAVTGCGANFGAQTNQPYQPAVGISNRTSAVYTIDTLVVTDGQGNGTIVSALVNESAQPDALASVTALDANGQAIKVIHQATTITLPARQAVQLGNSGAVRLRSSELAAGGLVTLTFKFHHAAPVEVQVPVVADSATYSKVPVGRVLSPAGRSSKSQS